MDKVKVIMDTDIGDDIDDAFALALLLQSPEVEIIGITTVYRNAFLRAKIASRLTELYGKRVPVYVGEDTPFNDPIAKFSFESMGEDGKPLIRHYDDSMKDAAVQPLGAVDYILREIEANPHQIVLLALGPLTNLARAYQKSPETFAKLKRIHMMGGDPFYPTREWNMACDADAANIVFTCGVPITMIGYNVTNVCRFNDDDVSFVNGLQQEGNRLLAKMMRQWLMDNKYVKPPVMHDGLAAACLYRDFCDYVTVPIGLCLEKETRGRTVVVREKSEPAVMMKAASCVDKKAMIQLMRTRLACAE